MVKFVPVELKQLKANANEGASSSVGQEKRQKRKRSQNNCHQCHRNDRARVVRCGKCNLKKYCIRCIAKRYPGTEEAAFAEACASCRKICNCKACLRSKNAKKTVEKGNQNQGEGGEARPSFAAMKQKLEAMLERLAKEGHRGKPEVREHLKTSIDDLLQRIHARERASPSSS